MLRRPNILFVTPEARPLVKTGGLGDVAGALPLALEKQGADVRLLMPGFPSVMDGLVGLERVAEMPAFPAQGVANLYLGRMPDSGVPVYVVDFPPFYRREGGAYQDVKGVDWYDNPWRFALLSHIGALIARGELPDWRPDLVHCNDWQTGLLPAYLRHGGSLCPVLMGIHNLSFQGVFDAELTTQLGLPQSSFAIDGVEYYGNLSFLKAGIFYSDHIVAVSPTYAREIQGEPLGFGMQGLLAAKQGQLSGILNGIDVDEWNPARDSFLAKNFSSGRLAGKAANKRALQEAFGLQVSAEMPVLGMVSRIAYQKGLDLVIQEAEKILASGVQLVLLGTGEKALETAFIALGERYPGRVGVHIGFSEALSHQIEAGADIFLMPSRFEPCGLNQMYSMRYGTPPVVHGTGGLADTVVDLADGLENLDRATGFVFYGVEGAGLVAAVQRAVSAWKDNKLWKQLQKNGMTQDFSWKRSAKEYMQLYDRLLGYGG